MGNCMYSALALLKVIPVTFLPIWGMVIFNLNIINRTVFDLPLESLCRVLWVKICVDTACLNMLVQWRAPVRWLVPWWTFVLVMACVLCAHNLFAPRYLKILAPLTSTFWFYYKRTMWIVTMEFEEDCYHGIWRVLLGAPGWFPGTWWLGEAPGIDGSVCQRPAKVNFKEQHTSNGVSTN